MLVMTLVALVLCFTRHTGGPFGFWLLLTLIGAFATTLAFIQARISENAHGDTLSEYELKRLREGKNPVGRD